MPTSTQLKHLQIPRESFEWLRCNSVTLFVFSCRIFVSVLVFINLDKRSQLLVFKNLFFSQHGLGSRVGAPQRSSYPSGKESRVG